MSSTAVAGVDRGVAVCPMARLEPERGAAALVGEAQVALFRLRDDTVHAIDNRDPATGVNVLARGLLGTTSTGEWYVASPLHKHRYSLTDGRCLDDDRLRVGVHRIVVLDGHVHVMFPSSSTARNAPETG